MQKIDRKLMDLIVEARRLRGSQTSRWDGYRAQSEPQSDIGADLRDVGPNLVRPYSAVGETHFA